MPSTDYLPPMVDGIAGLIASIGMFGAVISIYREDKRKEKDEQSTRG